MSAPLCGKITRKGTPCRMPLRGGKCATHNSDLSARNSAVAHAAQRNNPEAFERQHRAAGQRGHAVTGAAQWAFATEQARQWRLAHPSQPEKRVCALLAQHLDLTVDYDREYIIDSDARAVDFAFPFQKCVIEVVGHQYKASFGESAPRAARLADKIAWLNALGWNVHVYDASPNADPDAEKIQLLSFLSLHHLTDCVAGTP